MVESNIYQITNQKLKNWVFFPITLNRGEVPNVIYAKTYRMNKPYAHIVDINFGIDSQPLEKHYLEVNKKNVLIFHYNYII